MFRPWIEIPRFNTATIVTIWVHPVFQKTLLQVTDKTANEYIPIGIISDNEYVTRRAAWSNCIRGRSLMMNPGTTTEVLQIVRVQ